MTENIPPIPPALQAPEPAPQPYPTQPPEGYGPPVYQAPPQAPQYVPAGYPAQPQQYGHPQASYPPQGYAVPGPYAQPPQQGAYYQQPGQWVPGAPTGPKSSGSRVAAGIVEIALAIWLFFPATVGLSNGQSFLGFLFLVAFLGNMVAGILLLIKHRGRAQSLPITTLSFAGFAALLSLVAALSGFYGVVMPIMTLPLAVPVLIIMGIGLAKEKRGL